CVYILFTMCVCVCVCMCLRVHVCVTESATSSARYRSVRGGTPTVPCSAMRGRCARRGRAPGRQAVAMCRMFHLRGSRRAGGGGQGKYRTCLPPFRDSTNS